MQPGRKNNRPEAGGRFIWNGFASGSGMKGRFPSASSSTRSRQIQKRLSEPELLVDYGKALYRSGKAYGIYAETINSVSVERPLIRRQLTSAWDLACAWLIDEPHSHHPAMPLSVMAAMVLTALYWGWAHEAAVIMMSWAGVMRIGEVLAARRKDLVLPRDSAPGSSFLLIVVQQPKTRGRSAKHLDSMYKDAPPDAPLWPYSAATLRKRFTRNSKGVAAAHFKDYDFKTI